MGVRSMLQVLAPSASSTCAVHYFLPSDLGMDQPSASLLALQTRRNAAISNASQLEGFSGMAGRSVPAGQQEGFPERSQQHRQPDKPWQGSSAQHPGQGPHVHQQQAPGRCCMISKPRWIRRGPEVFDMHGIIRTLKCCTQTLLSLFPLTQPSHAAGPAVQPVLKVSANRAAHLFVKDMGDCNKT